jgi:hypothetical protein
VPLCGLVGRQFGQQQSSCRPTVVGAVGEQRIYAHHGALPPSYLSTVEKCSVVISLAPQRDDQLGRSAAAPNARLQAAEHAREIPQVTGFHPANGLLIAAPAARVCDALGAVCHGRLATQTWVELALHVT